MAPGERSQLLDKGKQVYVEGRLQSRSYDDKDGKKVYTTEVVADEIILLGGRGEGGGPETGTAPRAAGYSRGKAASAGAEDDPGPLQISDDDVPF